jgi:chromosome segregation ATPase
LKSESRTLESLKRPIQDIARYSKEIDDLEREIARYEGQLRDSGGALSGAEIRAKMDALNERRTKIQRDLKATTAEKEKSRVRIQGYKDQISSTKFRLTEGENRVNAKKSFLRDLEESKELLIKAQDEVKVNPLHFIVNGSSWLQSLKR